MSEYLILEEKAETKVEEKMGYPRCWASHAVSLISSLVWMLRRVGEELCTDVPRQHVSTIFKCQEVQEGGLVGHLK